MRVHGLGNNPAWGQGSGGVGGADRAHKDGQRKGGNGKDPDQQRRQGDQPQDQVQLNSPPQPAVDAADGLPRTTGPTQGPAGTSASAPNKSQRGPRPPIDLSA